jgi:2-iminoacetate synthase ThiH
VAIFNLLPWQHTRSPATPLKKLNMYALSKILLPDKVHNLNPKLLDYGRIAWKAKALK